ncbi:MAG TPA: Gfo/Idh/MocA family oxidoreductase [Nitriliruptorales bacterium]
MTTADGHPTPSTAPVRVAMVGCGAIARRMHVPALLAAGARIPVFVSRTEASARAAADEAGGGEVATDWRAVVMRDDLDAVSVCTPNALHAPIAIAAAEAGKHVLVEKPFATTVGDADAMIAAADRAGTVLMAAHNLRFAAPFAPMRDAIARGDIGAPTSARVAFCHAGPQAWSPGSVWFRDAGEAGGGALMDLGGHVIDTLRFVLADEFDEVTATLDRLPIDEDAVVGFRTSAGVVGAFHAGWRSRGGGDQSVVVHGEAGSITFDLAGGLRITRDGSEPEPVAMDAPPDDPCAAFVRAVAQGAAPSPSAADGRAAVAVIAAAYDAARTGTTRKVAR